MSLMPIGFWSYNWILEVVFLFQSFLDITVVSFILTKIKFFKFKIYKLNVEKSELYEYPVWTPAHIFLNLGKNVRLLKLFPIIEKILKV